MATGWETAHIFYANHPKAFRGLGRPSLWEVAERPPFWPSSKDWFKEEEKQLLMLFHNLCLDLLQGFLFAI